MFDYKLIVNDTELTMQFIKLSDTILDAFSIEDDVADFKDDPTVYQIHKLGYITLNEITFDASNPDVFVQYKLWQTRPERKVGQFADIEGKNLEELTEIYEELLIGAYILTHHTKILPGNKYPFVPMIDWLRTTDFYTAPASSQYHDSFPGGLLVHSLKVYNKMIELISNVPSFSKVNVAEATIVALVHDWCKIGYYEKYDRNVKNEATGQWEKVPSYKINQQGIPLGHGTTSLYIAMKMLKLSVEQALAIRWHMGEYNVADNEMNELHKANAEYPMVYLIQFADRLSCVEY